MRLLLTAFEPFGGELENPSARVLDALRSDLPEGIRARLLELPVERGVAAKVVRTEWRSSRFDVWLGLGQAGGRSAVSVERVGRNRFRASGGRWRPRIRTTEGLEDAAPEAYLCRWPAFDLVRALRNEGHPVSVSYSAGLFVCNEVLFRMEHDLRPTPSAWAGFLHLPYLPEQLVGKPPGTAALPLEIQVGTVRRVLEWLRDAFPAPPAVTLRRDADANPARDRGEHGEADQEPQ